MEYQVELEMFRGPLDLLLFLVKRNEVDICDIPVARVAEQFLAYLNLIQLIDVEWAGDFLVMAATLMEIKSRMLLPRPEELAVEEEDPRKELVRQLLEYKKYKDASSLLERRAELQLLRLPREPIEAPARVDPSQQPLQQVELWDLVSAFGRLMRETLATRPQQVVVDETPIQVYMEQIKEKLKTQPCIPFRELFLPPYTRGRLLGLFLAVLELIKGRWVKVEQEEPFAEIYINAAPREADDGAAPSEQITSISQESSPPPASVPPQS